jgi:hypothetical protein
MQPWLRGLGIALALLLASCDDDDGGVLIAVNTGGLRVVFVDCPDCKETVTLRAYGRYPLRGTDANVASQLAARCGFLVFSDPTSTQVQGCSSGVDLAFVGGDLQAFRVRSGWDGRTESGIAIGSSMQDVLAAEPGFARVDERTLLLDDGDRRAEAGFASDQRLVELIVGRGFRR